MGSDDSSSSSAVPSTRRHLPIGNPHIKTMEKPTANKASKRAVPLSVYDSDSRLASKSKPLKPKPPMEGSSKLKKQRPNNKPTPKPSTTPANKERVQAKKSTTTINAKAKTVSKAGGASNGAGDVDTSNGFQNQNQNHHVNDVKAWNFIGKKSISMGLDENMVKVGLELSTDDDTKAEIEDKWNQIYLDEAALFIRKLDLARQETNLIIQAIKSKSGGTRDSAAANL